MKTNWGDDEFNDDYLPPKTESKPDKDGIIIVTEYKFNEKKEKIKVIKRVKRYTKTKRVSRAAIERRKNWIKFGAAVDAEENKKITFASYDAIDMENPNQETSKDDQLLKRLDGHQSVVVCRKCGKDHWTNNCPYKDLKCSEIPSGSDDKPKDNSASDGTRSGYVPPHLRAGFSSSAGGRDREEEETLTLKVSNISKRARESDIRELFDRFGKIHRLYVAKDRETNESRGFAFISFYSKSDAEAALQGLDGHGYDHLILKLEWAKPSKKNVGAESGISGKYVSGYGKALPQGVAKKN